MKSYNKQDKRYFKETIKYWEQAKNKDIKEWLKMAEKLANKSKERAIKRVTHNQPRITSHFAPVTTTAPQDRCGNNYN
jgi:ribosomal protein L18E